MTDKHPNNTDFNADTSKTSVPFNYTLHQNTVLIDTPEVAQQYHCDGSLYLSFLNSQVLRVHTGHEKSYAVETATVETTAAANPLAGLSPVTKDGSLFLQTADLQVSIDQSLHISIAKTDGSLLCSDYCGTRNITSEQMSPEELEQMIQEGHVVHQGEETCKFHLYKTLYGDETFYGLGDKTGFLNKKGYDFMMWNSDNPDPHVENPTFKALYKSIPFFITLRDQGVYGIFLDNPHKSFFDMGFESDQYYSFGSAAGELDYYFMYGDTIAEVIGHYTAITGRSPLPQMWTLGYHQSRWSYSSAEEVLELARSFQKYNIPCDAIHLDIDYMERFKVFTSDSEAFPDLKALSKELQSMGIKLVTIIDPGVKAEKGYPVYDTGIEKHYFATTPDGDVYHNEVWPGDSVFPDFTSDKVRKWWGHQSAFQVANDIRGIWNDMNEPASFKGPLPDDVVFPGDDTDDKHLHSEVHNVYGHLMAKATYEGLKEEDGRRPFVITRACYSGSQKYTTAWTGDNQSLWSHLKMSIPQLLNLGMSGMPLVGTDIGGFGSHTTPELLSRWVEASCFAPLFRNHSAKYTRRQEPWQFDQTTLDINRQYIKLHYKFLPYLYNLCYEETQTGLPLLRPLVLHYQNDPAVRECNDEYLVGDSILVAPVTEQGARTRMVYLPEGEWIDYWTQEHLDGGRYILREAPLDICPIYVKAGSLLPTWSETNYVPEQETLPLIVEYYPAAKITSVKASPADTSLFKASTTDGTLLYYQDNGTDFAYETGEYNLYEFTIETAATSPKLITNIKHQGYPQTLPSVSLVVR